MLLKSIPTCKLDPIFSYLLNDITLLILPFSSLNHDSPSLSNPSHQYTNTASNYFSHLITKNSSLNPTPCLTLPSLFANVFPFLSKFLERVVYIHSLHFFSSHSHSSAFVPSSSIKTVLVSLSSSLT